MVRSMIVLFGDVLASFLGVDLMENRHCVHHVNDYNEARGVPKPKTVCRTRSTDLLLNFCLSLLQYSAFCAKSSNNNKYHS